MANKKTTDNHVNNKGKDADEMPWLDPESDDAAQADVEEASAEESESDQPVSDESDAQSERIQQLEDELAKAKEEVLLVHADMQNLRRRTERDVENAHKFALDKFARELLSVVDNLERALDTTKEDDEATKAIREGIELTYKSFLDTLARFDVEQIDPLGEPFNPELHQAVSMVPNPDAEPNSVMNVFQKGYTLNKRLVRPAMVVVVQG